MGKNQGWKKIYEEAGITLRKAEEEIKYQVDKG